MTPDPISTLGYDAFPYAKDLQFFLFVGRLMKAGHLSLRAVAAELRRLDGLNALPDYCRIHYSCVARLPTKLVPLFDKLFRRPVTLYAKERAGWPVLGLSEDGEVALRMTEEYLAAIGL